MPLQQDTQEFISRRSLNRRGRQSRRQDHGPVEPKGNGLIPQSAPFTIGSVLEAVRSAVRVVIGQEVPPVDAPLMSSGLDSLGAVELRNSLEASLGLDLPSTLVRK